MATRVLDQVYMDKAHEIVLGKFLIDLRASRFGVIEYSSIQKRQIRLQVSAAFFQDIVAVDLV